MATELTTLAQKIEALGGANAVVDELVLLATGWTLERAPGLGERATWIDPSGRRTSRRQGDGWFKPTASIDAAMTLVPEGWGWQATFRPGADGCDGMAWGAGDFSPTVHSDAATPALALCAASLRARAALQEKE